MSITYNRTLTLAPTALSGTGRVTATNATTFSVVPTGEVDVPKAPELQDGKTFWPNLTGQEVYDVSRDPCTWVAGHPGWSPDEEAKGILILYLNVTDRSDPYDSTSIYGSFQPAFKLQRLRSGAWVDVNLQWTTMPATSQQDGTIQRPRLLMSAPFFAQTSDGYWTAVKTADGAIVRTNADNPGDTTGANRYGTNTSGVAENGPAFRFVFSADGQPTMARVGQWIDIEWSLEFIPVADTYIDTDFVPPDPPSGAPSDTLDLAQSIWQWTHRARVASATDASILLSRSNDLEATWVADIDTTVDGASPSLSLPTDGSLLLATSSSGAVRLHRSTDGGTAWTPMASPGNGYHTNVLVPFEGAPVWFLACSSSESGTSANILLYRSYDQGATWKPSVQVNDPLASAPKPQRPGLTGTSSNLICSYYDANGAIVVRRSKDCGSTWSNA